MLSTGCKGLDDILGGGVRFNTITNVYGPSGTGKTQLCFQLSVIASSSSYICFIDTLNNFRPERVLEMADYKNSILDRIYVARVYNIDDAMKVIERIDNSVRLLIIDDISELTFNIPLKRIESTLVRFIHKVALKTVKEDLATIITNKVTYKDSQLVQKYDKIISRFTHFKLVFNKINTYFLARLIYPFEATTYFKISRKGLEDYL